MKATEDAIVVESLERQNEYGPDDLFICCASFENRCLSSLVRMGSNYRVRFSIIFVIDEPNHQKLVDTNLYKMQALLSKKTSEGIFVIRCQRADPIDGLTQLKNNWKRVTPKDSEEPYVTLDISGFTKVYMLGLLHFLVAEMNMGLPRMLHTTQSYAPSRLTQGVEQITTIPNFFGSISMEKETLLVLFLGFEPERATSVWKNLNPQRTLCLITSPRDGNEEYLRYAEKNNAQLLSQPGVDVRQVAADNPFSVRNVLEDLYEGTKGMYNLVIGPFGTKPQAVGVFLYWLEHPKAQVVYSFPIEYTKSYLKRRAGQTYLLPLSPSAKGGF